MERVYSVFVWAFAVLSAYLAPMKEVFWCMLLFVTIDLIVGIIASSKNGIGRLWRSWQKRLLLVK